VSSRRGLPTGLSMRHDAHYVEELTHTKTTHVGRLIPIDKLDPNPEQPRTEIGDLTELSASIREKGVLEPLLVKPTDLGRWMIIAGERRWRAATAAGLSELPCIEMDVDASGVAEIALIENMQRKDLTPWEEADGLRALCERFGYTHEDVARKVGKSRSTVTEALSIASIPAGIREVCREGDINSKSLLLQIVRQPDDESMRAMAEQIASEGLTRDGARKARKAFIDPTGASEPYVYRFEAPGREFKVEVKFKKPNVSVEELFEALNAAAQNIDDAI
jgi:ParB family transcriptional regulator, chromosome partitioning protein